MNVLLVGNGAREHVIAEAICRSPQNVNLFSFMKANNPGIASLSKKIEIGDINDGAEILKFAKDKKVDIAIVGPEAPLSAGVVDKLNENYISCASPTSKAAKIETNKEFMRNLMEKYQCPGSIKYKVCKNKEEVDEFISKYQKPIAVKPLGLTGGKGVKVIGDQLRDLEEAKKYAYEILDSEMSGHARVILEELLIGEEYTLQAFVDGKNIVGTPAVQDHKRAYDGDVGPNTGGMGSYSYEDKILPFMTQKDYDQGIKIIKSIIDALKKETNHEYRGIIYGQFMLTKEGPKVVEINARFGDPEAMNVLPLLKSDYIEICQAIIDGKLDQINVEFEKKAAVCKYVVPKGYPDNPKSNEKIEVKKDEIEKIGAKLYYASVNKKEDGLYMSSSRAIACLGIADNIKEAEKISRDAIKNISGPIAYREDIGTEEVISKRINHMNEIRA